MLVLDDDAKLGRLLARAVAGTNLRPRVTTTVQDFHIEFETSLPRLIVLDLQLGREDGVEQLRYLSARRFPHALILVSGYDDRVLATAAELARNQGLHVAAALCKPIEISEFRALAHRAAAQPGVISPEAIEEGRRGQEFILEYQPIVHSQTGEISKFEALVRWNHPTLGLLPPGRFIPIVEENPMLATAITEYVVDLALAAKLVNAAGAMVPVNVNVPPRCLYSLDFPDRIEACLTRRGATPDRLCLEITETAAFEDMVQTMDTLTRLRLKGIHLALDDFGTGYSSLKLLRRLPFSVLKIDRSLVFDIDVSREAQAIIRSIVKLAAELGLETVAEGVESQQAAARLASLGVGYLQGFALSRPMSEAAIAKPIQIKVPGAAMEEDITVIDPPALSPRQMEIMQLVGSGLTVKEIARQLQLSVGTVKTHLALAYTALGARNRIEALRLAGWSVTCPEKAGGKQP